MNRARPPLWLGTLAVFGLAAVWGLVRLGLFQEQQAPLSYVIPLLVCVWSRRRWHLLAMAGVFLLMATAKYFWILPDAVQAESESTLIYVVTLINVVVGTGAVAAIMHLREVTEAQSDAIQKQYSELEAQAEELAQQNEEIKSQGEELAQQNEEIQSQSEELHRQNEELVDANARLTAREAILYAAAEAVRLGQGTAAALDRVCARILTGIGAPCGTVAVAECDGKDLVVRAQVQAPGEPTLPRRFSRSQSLAGLVLERNRPAYVDDMHQRPDLAQPFGDGTGFRSVLAAPVTIAGAPGGVILACSRPPAHWTKDQFQLLEWSAVQCGLLLESIRSQAALRERTTAVEAASRAKDDFLATLSHELRTPLTPVLVAAEDLVQTPGLPDDVREQLEMVRRNVAVQSRLIDDLLDLTRISRGKIDLNVQPVCVRTLINQTAAVVAGDLAGQAQRLELEIDLPPQARVSGDAARLQQVFWNLLKNSAKFSPAGAIIRIRASVTARAAGEKPRLVVDVVDEGSGIAPDDIERIFQPFEQATAGHRQRGLGGLGLGLSIARAITELHDGSIRVRSDGAGKGAVFTVELPLELDERSGEPSLAVRAEPGVARQDGRPSRVLLVEDHADTAAAIVRVLRGAGFAVDHAPSVDLALERWRHAPFDLLISDVGLPDGTGLDVLRRIQADGGPRVRAICMSGYGMENDLEQSRQAGFDLHLIKPVSKPRLLSAIHEVLGRPIGEDRPAGAT